MQGSDSIIVPPANFLGTSGSAARVTSGIVSTGQGWKIALYFTGTKHAGENLAEVLKRRAKPASPPIQMCDALSRNVPKLPAGVEILLANCLAHGRRQFVEVAANFPDECRYVLEMLGQVYGYDAEARERSLTPEERLQLHQAHSGPVMEKLHQWLEAQFAERKTEPNSGLGKAITYLLRHVPYEPAHQHAPGIAAQELHEQPGEPTQLNSQYRLFCALGLVVTPYLG